MRTHVAGGKSVPGWRRAGFLVQSFVNKLRILGKDRSETRSRLASSKAGPTVADRQNELVRFYERYEEFVELLCDAAQYGPNPKLEGEYERQRTWLAAGYPGLRPYLGAYLRHSPEPPGAAARDAFQTLTGPETLSEFLISDDGGMIATITQTREALNLYAEHLRQLADKTG